jgi:hypothetical protein
MARRPGAGRKSAKNEAATALLAALKFGSVLKTATTTSMVQAHYVFMNTGTAIMFDGVVAAGHPIPADIAGYPHAKLLAEALDNTDKTFTLTVHDNGNFEIGSDKYSALVPALEYSQVIPTFPDNQQVPIRSPDLFLAAMNNALKVTVETGDVVLYSSVRFTGGSIMGTNGAAMLETRVEDQLPEIIVPRQFVASVVKAAATLKPIGMGLSNDWTSFTVWFENGAWLRTNLYDNDTWPTDALDLFYQAINASRPDMQPLDPKLWAAINAVLPFTDTDQRVIIRPGIVRTHPDRHHGAALEVKECTTTFDVDGKRFAALAEVAKNGSVLNGFEVPLMVVFGDNCRGIVAGLQPLPEPETSTGPTSGWGSGQPSPQEPASKPGGSWSIQGSVEPPPEGSAEKQTEWKGGPQPGNGYDPEFLSAALDQPESDFRDDDNFILVNPGDTGIVLNNSQFKPSTWVDNLTDEDGGFNTDNNTNGW